jgi:Tol biopolymer transport system component
MPRVRALVITLVLGGALSACSLIVSTSGLSEPATSDGGTGSGADGGLDAGDASSSQAADAGDAADAAKTPPSCDLAKPFGAMTQLTAPVSSSSNELAGSFSPDRLTIYVASDRAGGGDIFVFHRPNEMAGWSASTPLDSLNTAQKDSDPWVSADQLTIYFDSYRPSSAAGANIFVATRTSVSASFGVPVLVSGVASDADDREPWVTPLGDRMYFASTRGDPSVMEELYMSERAADGTFAAPRHLSELGSADSEESAFLTADELTVYFSSGRSGGAGDADIWMATRADKNTPFGAPVFVPSLSTAAADFPSWLSDDGCQILIESYTTGDAELFYSERPK